MNLYDLTISQLKRAAAIKEQIEELNGELRSMLGGSARSGTTLKESRISRAAGKKTVAGKPAARSAKGKKKFSAATRAKLSAKLKAYWAAKRAGKK